ncbi:MAG: Rieske (2Fe-2S) protein [Deltaproteobacteria bacterium]|nr:Rieske (2Fe-2S) protein [Deltaproteobacteria bacterium]
MGEEDLERREFLKHLIFGLGGLIAAGIAIPGGVYFLSPLWKETEEDWVELGKASAIPPGEPVKVDFIQRKKDGWTTIEGRSSCWVVTPDGVNFTAYNPLCTHLGCPYRWDGERKQFLCPCHTAVFSIDGEVVSGPPPRPLDRFPIRIAGGNLLIKPVSPKKET